MREGGVFFSEVSRKKIKKEEEEYSLRNRVLRETNYCTKNMKKMYILAKSRFLIKPPFMRKHQISQLDKIKNKLEKKNVPPPQIYELLFCHFLLKNCDFNSNHLYFVSKFL